MLIFESFPVRRHLYHFVGHILVHVGTFIIGTRWSDVVHSVMIGDGIIKLIIDFWFMGNAKIIRYPKNYGL